MPAADCSDSEMAGKHRLLARREDALSLSEATLSNIDQMLVQY
jgi:hypothetical protein